MPIYNFENVTIPFFGKYSDYILSYSHISSTSSRTTSLIFNLKTKDYHFLNLYLYDNLTELNQDKSYGNYLEKYIFRDKEVWDIFTVTNHKNKTFYFIIENTHNDEADVEFEVISSESTTNLTKLFNKNIYPKTTLQKINIFFNIPRNHQKYILYGYKGLKNNEKSQLLITQENSLINYSIENSGYFENYYELKNDNSYKINLQLFYPEGFTFYFSQSNYIKIFKCEINKENFQQFPIISETKILLDMTSIYSNYKMLIEYEAEFSTDLVKIYGYDNDRSILQSTSEEKLEFVDEDCSYKICHNYIRKKNSDLKYAIFKVSAPYGKYTVNVKYGEQEKYFPRTIYISCGMALAFFFPNLVIHLINKLFHKHSVFTFHSFLNDLFFHLAFFNIISKLAYLGGKSSLIIGLISLFFYIISTYKYFKDIFKDGKDEKIYNGLGCLHLRSTIRETLNEAVNKNKDLPPKLIIKARAFHKESREAWKLDTVEVIEGMPITINTGYGPSIDTREILHSENVTHVFNSEWERVDKGGGKLDPNIRKNLFNFKCYIEEREVQTWYREEEIKYNSWRDDTEFYLNDNNELSLRAEFKFKINLDDERYYFVENLKNEMTTEAKTHDTQFEIKEVFEVPGFEKLAICLHTKEYIKKNFKYFIYGIIITLLGYCSLLNYFVYYEPKVVEIEMIKSVSISELFKRKTNSQKLISDNSKLLIPQKIGYGYDKKEFLLEPLN